MSTQTWSSRVRHDTDATYQEWRDEFMTKMGLLVAAGVLAADETTVVAGAGTRPTNGSTEESYAVFHLNDSLHATAPIYMRFAFFGNTTGPRINFQVGTSTNGSGVLGGTALATNAACNASIGQTGDTARISYLCAAEGFFGFFWKSGSGSEATAIVCRTCDEDGVPTALGALAHWGAGSASAIGKRQSFRYQATAAAYTAKTVSDGMLGFSPMSPSVTTIGSDTQIFLGWTITPRPAPLFGLIGVYAGEKAAGTTFSATPVGASARTFLTLGSLAGPFGHIGIGSTGACSMAMLWE